MPSLSPPPIVRPPPFLLRGVARIVDLGVQMFLLDLAFRIAQFLPAGLLELPEGALVAIDLGVGLGALVLYTTLSEALGGATLGKLLTGLRVTRLEGGAIDARAALIRNLGFLVDGLFFGLVAYSAAMRSPEQQRIGDAWAGTRVVWRSDAPELSPWRGVPVGMLAALALVVLSYLVAR